MGRSSPSPTQYCLLVDKSRRYRSYLCDIVGSTLSLSGQLGKAVSLLAVGAPRGEGGSIGIGDGASTVLCINTTEDSNSYEYCSTLAATQQMQNGAKKPTTNAQ